MERRTFLASAAAAATAMALDPAKADTLPLGNLPNWRYPDPRVEVLDDKKFKYMVGNAAIERIATGFRWAEGPVYFRDGGFLVWSDIPNNRMMRWLEEDGHVSVFRTPSNYTNGNTRDREGRLISCEHDARRVTRTEPDGTINVLLDSYEGKKLNAPNDVVVASDGAIWFTDPGLEPLVEHFDTRIGIAPVGKVAQRQDVCVRRPQYRRGGSRRRSGQERPSLHHDLLRSPRIAAAATVPV